MGNPSDADDLTYKLATQEEQMKLKPRFAILAGAVLIAVPALAAADTCSGLYITGVFKDQEGIVTIKGTLTIKDKNAFVAADPVKENADAAKEKKDVRKNPTLPISSGSIIRGKIESADSCAVEAVLNGVVASVTVKNAKLTDVWIDKATITIDAVANPKVTIANVNGVNGSVTGLNVTSASVVTSPDLQNDPLSLSGSSEIITLSNIGDGSTIKIKEGIKLHYQDSKAGTYTLFTTAKPTDCHGLPEFLSFFCNERTAGDQDYVGKPFVASADELRNKVLVRRWTTGVLLVPYKYGIANHSIVSGSISLGPYLGYSTDLYGTESTLVLSAGIVNVPVPTNKSDGTATNVNKQGLSVATGFLFKVAGKTSPVTAGFLIGVDQLGQDSQYKDNGKPWIGLYVGAGFGN